MFVFLKMRSEINKYKMDEKDKTSTEPLINVKKKKKRKPRSHPMSEKSNDFLNESGNAQEKISDPPEVSDIIGKGGWWQIKILILTAITGIPISWNHLGMSFLAFPVDHWCARPIDADISLDSWWTEFLPNTTIKGQQHHSQCEMFAFNTTTRRPEKSRKVYCESYEYSIEFNSIVNEWDLVCEKEVLLSTSQTVYMIGFLIAVMLTGQFADMYGRHPAIMVNIVILITAGFAATFSTSFLMFAICRFFIAIGTGGLGLVQYILLVETLGAEKRVLYMFIQGTGWHIGYITLPLICWLQPDWLMIQLSITAPSLIFLSYFWLLPESPRWLLVKGKFSKALSVLKTAAETNGLSTENLEERARSIANLHLKDKGSNSKKTVIDLLRTPNLRMKTLSLYFIWAVIAFTYYGLSLNTNDLQGNEYINFFISGVMEIPSSIFCMVTLDRYGRKKPFIITLLFTGLACFACIFVPKSLLGIQTTLAMTGKFFNSAAFGIVYIYSSEIYPTVVRNVGVGSSSTVARIGSAVAPFMKDLGHVTNPSVPLVLFGVLSIISALILLKLPETNKHPMPESIEDAEEFGKKPDSVKEETFNPEKVIISSNL